MRIPILAGLLAGMAASQPMADSAPDPQGDPAGGAGTWSSLGGSVQPYGQAGSGQLLREAVVKRQLRRGALAKQIGFKVGAEVIAIVDVTEGGNADLADHTIARPNTAAGEHFDPTYVHGAAGDRGDVVHVEPDGSATVMFRRKGTATLVNWSEVVPTAPHGFSSSPLVKARLAAALALPIPV
jgi:hypothetical protein